MYRITLLISERQCEITCYAQLNPTQHRLLSENINTESNDHRVLPEDGFDEGGDCCSMNCSDPCGLCLYHPIIMTITETTNVSFEINEHIIHKIIEWIEENQDR